MRVCGIRLSHTVENLNESTLGYTFDDVSICESEMTVCALGHNVCSAVWHGQCARRIHILYTNIYLRTWRNKQTKGTRVSV